MKRITYVSNTDVNQNSGGGSGINFATYQELEKYYDVFYCGPISPGSDLGSKILSKIRRKVGLKGNYHFFSERRLSKIRGEFEEMDRRDSFAYFFHGFTPWIKINPSKPYFCFNDACFATYVDIYNNKNEFLPQDLERIYVQEAEWLKKAEKVFFRSRWALEETMKFYSISGENFEVAGVGGFIDIPVMDSYKSGYNFLFISREFLPKGGLTTVQALQQVRMKYPKAQLWIVGDRPEQWVLDMEGVEYKGFYKKNEPVERKALQDIFSKSFALIHPTLKDTNTLVITELAYYGCPAISTKAFAIPEYLLNEETGLLLNNPRDVQEVAEKMLLLIENPKLYKQMRIDARENAIANNTWEKVGKRIATKIAETS